jgi:hypothetical protein
MRVKGSSDLESRTIGLDALSRAREAGQRHDAGDEVFQRLVEPARGSPACCSRQTRGAPLESGRPSDVPVTHAPTSYANGAAGASRPTREIGATGAASVMPPAAAPARPRASAGCGGHGSAVRALRNTCFLLSRLVAGAFRDARNRRPTDASPFCWPHALRAAVRCCTGRCHRRAGLCVARWVLAADRVRTERPARIKWIEIQG